MEEWSNDGKEGREQKKNNKTIDSEKKEKKKKKQDYEANVWFVECTGIGSLHISVEAVLSLFLSLLSFLLFIAANVWAGTTFSWKKSLLRRNSDDFTDCRRIPIHTAGDSISHSKRM